MSERRSRRVPSLTARSDQPLIGIIFEENGQELVRYFTDEEAADKALPENVTEQALSVIGAWSDLDWEDMKAALDRIRHESQPTSPITNCRTPPLHSPRRGDQR